jgi:hypothetical protein
MTTTFAPGTRLVDVMPGNERVSYTVGSEGCETVACEQPVADDYDGEACGCLLVDVAASGGRVLVEESRVVEFGDEIRTSTRDDENDATSEQE